MIAHLGPRALWMLVPLIGAIGVLVTLALDPANAIWAFLGLLALLGVTIFGLGRKRSPALSQPRGGARRNY